MQPSVRTLIRRPPFAWLLAFAFTHFAAADSLPHAATQAERGERLYAFACAVCHGASGAGFEEAKLAFPEPYRDCARCHHPQNSPVMPGSEIMGSVMAFSLGDPPSLRDTATLLRFGTAGGLHAYLRATMPRWAPGSLRDQDYLDLTAYLLRNLGLFESGRELQPEGLTAPLLRLP